MNLTIDEIIDALKEMKKELAENRQICNPNCTSAPAELLHVKLVAYWTDAEVNGVREDEDVFKLRMPGQKGGTIDWDIDPKTGQIIDWPVGTTARTWYKVVDRFSYDYGRFHYGPDYVPDFFSIDDKSFGDYVYLTINAEGKIKGWSEDAFLIAHKKFVEKELKIHGENMLGFAKYCTTKNV